MRRIMPDIIEKQHLLELKPSASVREAARHMAKRNVRSVLVSQEGELEGIFTGTDLIRLVAEGADLDHTPIADGMTRNPHTIGPNDHAILALRRMQDCRCRHLPVVENRKLVGVVSRRDFHGFEIDEIEREDEIWETR